MPTGNPLTLSYTTATTTTSAPTIIASSLLSNPATIISSVSLTAMLVTATTLTTLTTDASEKENCGAQDIVLNSMDNSAPAMGIAGMASNLALTSSGLSLSLASVINNELTRQHQGLVKRTKGLAVIGTGLTEKCVRSQHTCTS